MIKVSLNYGYKLQKGKINFMHCLISLHILVHSFENLTCLCCLKVLIRIIFSLYYLLTWTLLFVENDQDDSFLSYTKRFE